MEARLKEIESTLCEQFCTEIRVSQKTQNLLRVETPFYFPDGDPYQIYLKELKLGGFRVTDMGHTLMHLSYENDLDVLKRGKRKRLLESILLEMGLSENDGEFYLDSTAKMLSESIMKLGQGISKILDLSFLNRYHVESTFHEDLKAKLFNLLDESKIIEDYIEERIEDALNYPIDYKVESKKDPLFIFGINNKDKARLTTITLERLIRYDVKFESLIIFQDFDSIPKRDCKRLMNVAGDMLSSLDATKDFERKIKRRVG